MDGIDWQWMDLLALILITVGGYFARQVGKRIETLEARIVADLGGLEVRMDRNEAKDERRDEKLHERITKVRDAQQLLDRRVTHIEAKVLNGGWRPHMDE